MFANTLPNEKFDAAGIKIFNLDQIETKLT